MSYKASKDYCTSSPEGVFGVKFNYACYLHDLDYQTKRRTRKEADKLFRQRIIKIYKRNHKLVLGYLVGFIYWSGVRLFGGRSW